MTYTVYWETGSICEGTIAFHHIRSLSLRAAKARAAQVSAETAAWVSIMRNGIDAVAYCNGVCRRG